MPILLLNTKEAKKSAEEYLQMLDRHYGITLKPDGAWEGLPDAEEIRGMEMARFILSLRTEGEGGKD